MKLIIVFVFLFALKMCGQSNSIKLENPSNNGFWSQPDKKKHFIATMGVNTVTYTFLALHPTYKDFSPLKKRVISFTLAILVGLIKETIDSRTKNNHFSS